MNPKTGYPKFVLKYHNGFIKLYDNEDTISKFYDYDTGSLYPAKWMRLDCKDMM